MNKLRVITVVGTRPEIIRLSRVMAALDDNPIIEHITIHTGQNYDYELNEAFYHDMEIRKPDFYLNAAGLNATTTIGQILINIDSLLEELKPHAFLVLGDTNSCLSAITAKKRQIPVFHMEAGNRCFDKRVPEELNRKIVDHIADINLTYSDIAREYLLREGFPANRIIKTGSPMKEVLKYYSTKIKYSDVLEKMHLVQGKYFLVSAHREENINDTDRFANLLECLNFLALKYGYPIIVSTHPRTRKKLEEFMAVRSDVYLHPLIEWQKPLNFSDYNWLQINAAAVLSDSGTISEESAILGFNALNIRESHERPEAMEETSVSMVGLNPERIEQGLMDIEWMKATGRTIAIVKDYDIDNVSTKIVRIILSYFEYKY